MSCHVAMYALMDSVKAEKVGRGVIGGRAALSLPEHGCKIIYLVVDSAFTHVVESSCNLEVEETSSQF